MNIENILATADAIEHHTIENLEFDMTTFSRRVGCKTAACIAGWGAAVAYGDEIQRATDMIQADAQQFFDISDAVADELFHATRAADVRDVDPMMFMSKIQAHEAVTALRQLVYEKRVNWLAIKYGREAFPEANVYAY